MSHLADGGQLGATAPHIRRYAAPYLVRMIKPNLIVSHDWHVQPFCQRSLRFIRLSGAVWIEAQAVKPGCPRTCCARRCGLPGQHPAFLREPSKTTKLPCWRQAQSVPLLRPLQQVVGGKFLSSRRSSGRKGDVPFKAGERSIQRRRAAQNIKERPAKRARATRARRSRTPGSCNGLFSAGFPTGVQGLQPHLIQRTIPLL